MKTTVAELPDSKIRLEVEVPEEAVQHAFEHAAADLAETMKIPGFRKGKKIPLPIVAARAGREALATEAVRSHIDSWFWDAAMSSGIRPLSSPDVEWDELPAQGGTFRFAATVPVPPKPEVADWTNLEVPAPEVEVPSDVVDAELERVRASVAELVPVSDRPAGPGDTVVVDLVAREEGKEPSEHRDFVVELGTGRLADELEEVIPGMAQGETKDVTIELPEGRTGAVAVTLKEIKEKALPALDDELARSATEFDTLAELREDIEWRLREQLDRELDVRFREDALDALVAASTVAGIEPLVERRSAALLGGLARSLGQRGVTIETYLTATGQTPEAMQASSRAEAERALKRELVLEAVAVELAVDVPDGEVEELIREQAAAAADDPDQAVAAMREHGGFEQLRGDLRLKKALDDVVSGVKRIPMDLARAREKLWTPEKEKAPGDVKIWTPGSGEETPR